MKPSLTIDTYLKDNVKFSLPTEQDTSSAGKKPLQLKIHKYFFVVKLSMCHSPQAQATLLSPIPIISKHFNLRDPDK